jgi:hypothetical protein
VNYFDAVDLDAQDIAFINTVNNSENFAYYGPYARIQLAIS